MTSTENQINGAADNNGAGIRYETGDLILNNDYFYNNQEGLLAAANPSGNLLITNTEFDHNGDGSGSTHNIYIGGDINSVTINDSFDRSVMPTPGPNPSFTPPPVVRRKLSNGLEVLVAERHGLPVLTLNLVVRGGGA